jgi:hypothetical protein
MSEREAISNTIEEFLNGSNYFDAPYGILSGLEAVGKGKVRTITFGVSRYLDAVIYIWSPKRISVKGRGGLAYKFDGEYKSADELINKFKKETNHE